MQISNVIQLGIKELRGLIRDPIMLALIVFAFSASVYSGAKALPETLNRAPIAIVDEDRSPLSDRIASAFYPPYFTPPRIIDAGEMDKRMDAGLDTFALDIPPNFERDLLANRAPVIQLNVDATRMTQAFNGSGYVQNILTGEVNEFARRYRAATELPVNLAIRTRFNPELNKGWFGSVTELINHITMLSIILTGAALIREREHGTVEHLLVMPVTPVEILLSKIWSMGLVVLVASTLSITLVVQGLLAVPLQGSVTLFLFGAALQLFATASMGIFLAILAGSMPQFGLLLMMVLLPLQVLSGATTPRESMPEAIQYIMMAAPNTHFVAFAQSVLFRGAGLDVVWPQCLALMVIGGGLFALSLGRFRRFLT
jgi:ABC-2 type transport system permease protein